jgi:hypothetical protein
MRVRFWHVASVVAAHTVLGNCFKEAPGNELAAKFFD